MDDQKQRNRRVNRIIVPVLGIIVLAFVIVLVVSAASGHKSAKYSASANMSTLTVIDPTKVNVGFTIKNTGDAAGAPTCMINASSDDGTYTGVDSVTINSPIQPGKTYSGADTLTITKSGAANITKVTVSC